MARTFTGTATTTPAALTITGLKATAVRVKNTDAATQLLVNVPAVHGTDYAPLDFGQVGEWGDPDGAISTINVKTAAGTATYAAEVCVG